MEDTEKLDRFFKYRMVCPQEDLRYIVDHLPASGTTRLTKKAFCIAQLELKQLSVGMAVNRCLRLPPMDERRGVLAWTVSAFFGPDSGALMIEQITVVHLSIEQIFEGGEGADHRHTTATVVADWNIDSLQWHPTEWKKGDHYQACMTNARFAQVTLYAALIDTWGWK